MSGDHLQPSGGDPAGHEPRHEQLLESMLVDGPPAPDDADTLARCPICSTRLARLRAVAGMLDTAGVEYRLVRDESLGPPLPGSPHRGPRPVRRVLPWVAAAAALLALCLVFVPSRGCAGTRAPDDGLLGPEPVPGFSPSGVVPGGAAWGPFSWPEVAVLDPRYVVEVFGVDGAGVRTTDPIVSSKRLSTTQWMPGPAEQASLQRWDRIRWSVVVSDPVTGKPTRIRETDVARE
jgi:hypothetical protein